MSKQVDERVLSMQFDNKRFEQNVSQSMSTLDKLKEKLHLKGASKGFEEVDAAAKKVDMKGLASNVETVSAKFSAMDVVAVTALANITNSAVEAGKKIVSALTIDPIKTGLSEYETKMNAVQVIKAGTRSKYLDNEEQQMKDIEKALQELNDYADQTIYNYAQMTSNVGKFVNQGLGVEEAVNAVRGMANLAGASGASAEDMARATLQMSQELGGIIRAQGWNSLRNANMANEDLKNVIKDFAKVEGLDIAAHLEKYGTFEKSLEEGWLTGDLFVKAMNVYSDVYSEAEYKAMGFTDEQIKNFKSLAETARQATTEVKTMSQLWDVLKETAQSGWTQTWELIFGDFNEAKKIFTRLQIYLSNIINKMSDWRNTILGGALDMGGMWDKIAKKIEESGLGKIVKTVDKVKDAVHDLAYYQEVFKQVWRGTYNNQGDNPDRRDLLSAAGYDPRVIQDLVNYSDEIMGYGKGWQYTLTLDDVERSHKKFGLTMAATSETTEDAAKSFGKLTEEQLKQAGLTDEEISLYKALEKEAGKLGISIEELVKRMSENDGRSMLIESFKNLWSALSGIFKAIKEAWAEIFDIPGVGELAIKLYGLIERFKQFTEKLRLTDAASGKLNENGEKLKRTFKGIVAILKLLWTIIGGPIRIAFKILTKILSTFNLNILDVTAVVGDAITAFCDWLDDLLDFTAVFEWMAPYIDKATKAIKKWIKETEPLGKIAGFFSSLGKSIKKAFASFKNSKAYEVGKNIISGIWTGIKSGAGKLWDVFGDILTTLIEKVKKLLGIHSPSVVFAAIGGFIIAGLLAGLNGGYGSIFDSLGSFFDKIISFVSSIDWGAVLTAASSLGMLFVSNKFAGAMKSVAGALEGIAEAAANMAYGIQRLGVGLGKYFKAKAWEARGKALLNFALAVGVLALSVYVLAQLDQGNLWSAVGAVVVLGAVLAALMILVNRLSGMGSTIKNAISGSIITATILPIALALLLVAIAVQQLGSMSLADVVQGTAFVILLGGLLTGLIAATRMWGAGFTKIGGNLMKIAIAIYLLVRIVQLIGGMEPAVLVQGIFFMAIFGEFIGGLIAATKLAGPFVNGLGKTIFKLAASILLLALTARLIGGMDTEKLVKGMVAIVAFGAIIAGLIAMTKIASGSTIAKVGATILAISVAMLIMTMSVGLLGMMDVSTLAKGVIVVAIFGVIINSLIKTIGTGQYNVKGLAFSILAIAVAIGVLALIAVLLGLVDTEHLAKGVIAVGLLSAMMAGLLMASGMMGTGVGAILSLVASVAILAAALYLLSDISPKKLGTAALAMSAMMGMFSVMIVAFKALNAVKVNAKMIGTIGLILGVIVILAGIIYVLSLLDVSTSLETVAGIALLALSLVAVMAGLTLLSKFGGNAIKGVASLFLLSIALLPFIGILWLLQGIENATENVKLLTMLVLAMTLVLIPLALVGALCVTALIGIVALSALVVPLLTVVGVLALMQGVKDAEKNAKLITNMLVVMTAVLVVLALVGPLALIGVAAAYALVGLISVVAVLALALGALMKIPYVKEFIETGAQMMILLAGCIGEMIGAFVKGIATQIASSLPVIGQCLTDFMNNASGFIEGAKNVDDAVAKGAGILVKAILALTVADFINGMLSFFSFGSSFADLGTQLSKFMENAKGFIDGASAIKPETALGIKFLSDAVLTLTKANLGNVLADFFGDDNSLSKFGDQLGDLGTDLNTFATNLGTFDPDAVTTVDCAGRAITALAKAADTIPNEGGWLSSIVGDNDILTFAAKLPDLGTHLKDFVTNLGKFDEPTVDTVECAGEAILALAEAADTIPNSGGWLAAIVGDNDILTFAAKLPDLGTHLKDFVTNLGKFDEPTVDTVECAGEAILALAEAADTIPNEGGLWSLLAGDNGLAAFSDDLPDLGTDLKDFVTNLGTFGQEQIDTVNSASKVITAIAKLGDTDADISDLGEELVAFADSLVDYKDAMADISTDSLNSANEKVTSVINVAKTMSDLKTDTLESFADDFADAAEDGVEGFVDAFEDEDPKEDLKKAVLALAKTAVSAIKGTGDGDGKSTKDHFKAAGKDCVQGFINGLKDKDKGAQVVAAGTSLGKAAYEAAKKALDEHSPSKKMYKVGEFAGAGLINALYDSVSGAYAAGKELGNSALDSTRSVMSRIVDAINSDMDAQPTIRPVLDLTDVNSGVATIGNMLSGTRTLSVNTSGIHAVSATMSNRQNGNDDLTSAINKLAKSNNKSGDTYNFNGFSYNEGSDVANAIQTLVRAAKMEGRT